MVFCGQCGYQLGPGDRVCPRCGAKTDAEPIEEDPGTYNPTEISHAIIERVPTQGAPSPNLGSQFRQPEPQGPLILGPSAPDDRLANEPTAMMSSPMYAPQAGYTPYPQQMGAGMYGYPAYQPYQAGQSAAVLQLLESSRKGKITSLLLILFGLLLLIGAIIVFLLTQQGIIFA
jgi:hypothetical protein